jgi:hypothetical protein
VAAYSSSSGRIDRPLRETLLEAHASMMAERPPQDGHRRTILDPLLTHVGIGLATVGGELRLTEEFTRVALEWVELPAGALRRGDWARFAGQTLPDWEVGLVEIRFEPPPHALSLSEVRRRGSYRLPPVVRTLRPLRHGRAWRIRGEGRPLRARLPDRGARALLRRLLPSPERRRRGGDEPRNHRARDVRGLSRRGFDTLGAAS